MTTNVVESGSAPKSLPSRMLGVITSPADTFRGIVAQPRWLDVMVVVTLLLAALQFWLLSTESGQVAVITILAYGAMTLIIGGILYAVFNAALGGNARFKQVLSVVAHAGVVPLLSALFATPLNYFRESMTSPTTLSVFLPRLEEGSFAGRFLGLIDLFLIWWVVVLAIGLAVLYRRKTQPILIGLLSVYILIGGVIALVMSSF